jgi:cytochrome c biogenesis protein CcdA
MQEWIRQALEAPTLSLTGLLAALLLGVLGAVSSCCNVAVLGAVAGYSGTLGEQRNRRNLLRGGSFFMLGTIVALAALGAVTGFVSQVAGASLGRYRKLFAGFTMIFFGLASLNLLPFKLPRPLSLSRAVPGGGVKTMVYGLALGGGTTACTAGCNPILPVALGMATLQGRTLWGAFLLGAFALGYSLPLTGALVGLGLGFGKLTAAAQKYSPAIKVVAGAMLIGVGFYLLATA